MHSVHGGCYWLIQQGEQGREVLQGALSVAEKESKASRQELLTVVEAEIKTRLGYSLNVDGILIRIPV